MFDIQPHITEIWVGTTVAVTILQLIPLSFLALVLGFSGRYSVTSISVRFMPAVVSCVFLKWLAITYGLVHWFDISGPVSVAFSFVIALIPFVGMIVGIVAAYQAWDWGILKAFAFFYSPGLIGSLLATLMSVGLLLLIAKFRDGRHRRLY